MKIKKEFEENLHMAYITLNLGLYCSFIGYSAVTISSEKDTVNLITIVCMLARGEEVQEQQPNNSATNE